MYYIHVYGSVRAIPTYRVYQLYDIIMCLSYLQSFSDFRTKVQILRKGVDMKTRIKVLLHFIAIMKVISHAVYIVGSTYTNCVVVVYATQFTNQYCRCWLLNMYVICSFCNKETYT